MIRVSVEGDKQEMERIKRVAKRWRKVGATIALLGLSGVFAAVVILAWSGWDLAWRVAVTGLVVMLVGEILGGAGKKMHEEAEKRLSELGAQ